MWKTNTIAAIFLLATILVGVMYWYMQKRITEFEYSINQKVEEKARIIQADLKEEKEKEINQCLKDKEKLLLNIETLHATIDFLKFGEEDQKLRNKIKENSKKESLKLTIEKGNIYKHKPSGIVIYIKQDDYEEQILLNLTIPNHNSEEKIWELGKFYYIFDKQEESLNEIMIFKENDKSVQLNWNYFSSK